MNGWFLGFFCPHVDGIFTPFLPIMLRLGTMKIISSGSWSKDWTSLALNLEVFHVMVSRGGRYILPTKWISSKASKCTWILWVQIDEGSCRYVYTPININQCIYDMFTYRFNGNVYRECGHIFCFNLHVFLRFFQEYYKCIKMMDIVWNVDLTCSHRTYGDERPS